MQCSPWRPCAHGVRVQAGFSFSFLTTRHHRAPPGCPSGANLPCALPCPALPGPALPGLCAVQQPLPACRVDTVRALHALQSGAFVLLPKPGPGAARRGALVPAAPGRLHGSRWAAAHGRLPWGRCAPSFFSLPCVHPCPQAWPALCLQGAALHLLQGTLPHGKTNHH